MRPKPRISLENRGQMLALSEEDYTQRQIAASVGCSQKSVSEILKKYRITCNIKDIKIPGRKRKTTERWDRIIVRKSKMDRTKIALQVKAKMMLQHGASVSTSTAQKRLREVRLFGRKPRKKPKLMTCRRKAHLQFAKTYIGWSARQWSKIVFRDESKFLLHRSDERVH